jgi:hypothetical protein
MLGILFPSSSKSPFELLISNPPLKSYATQGTAFTHAGEVRIFRSDVM